MRNADVWGWECFRGFMALDLTSYGVRSKTTRPWGLVVINVMISVIYTHNTIHCAHGLIYII